MRKKTASSQIPEPEFSFDNGISIADFFSYEAPNGEGLLDTHKLQDQTRSLHTLPDGLLPKFANNPFNPEEHYSSSSIDHAITGDVSSNLTHFDWLDLKPFEGVRSEDYPVDMMGRPMPGPSDRRVIKELEQQWGASTDGTFKLVANNARNVKPIAVATTPKYSFDSLKRMAKRSLEAGKPLKEITTQFRKLACGCDETEVESFVEYLGQERGLAGKVYVEAANYPNLLNGEHKELFRTKFAGVRYLIAEKGSNIASQYKTFWGKIVTEDVPWEEAYSLYAPKLTKAGYRVATGDPKTALRSAFLSAPVKQEKLRDYTQAYDATKYVTYKEAYEALKKASESPSRNLTWEQEVKAAQKKAFRTQLREETMRMIKAGYLTMGDVEQAEQCQSFQDLWKYATARIQKNMVQSVLYAGQVVKAAHLKPLDASPVKGFDTEAHTVKVAQAMLSSAKTAGFISETEAERISALPHAQWHTAITRIAAVKATRKLEIRRVPMKVATYAGEGTHIKDHVGNAGDYNKAAREKATHIANQDARVAEARLQHLVKSASISTTELERIKTATADPAKQLALADKVAKLKMLKAKSLPTESVPAQAYSGGYEIRASHRTAVSETQVIQKRAGEQRDLVVSQVKDWMNQGLYGKNLSTKIAAFYGDIASFLKEEILSVRKAHEGAAGFEYIDSSAYADVEGPKGCHKAANKKLAAKTVLACSSCATCPMASGGSCKRFNRPLVASVSVPLQTRKANVTKQSAALQATLSAPVFTDTYGLQAADVMSLTASPTETQVSAPIRLGGNTYE